MSEPICIETRRLGRVLQKVANLNKRAARNRLPGITAVHISDGVEPRYNFCPGAGWVCDKMLNAWKHVVEIHGVSPIVAGWRFVARIDHEPAGNILTKLDAAADDLPEQWRTAGSNCEHCKSRRARKVTYLLRGDAGQLMQVGSTCLDDFIRSEDLAALLTVITALRGGEDEEDGWSWRDDRPPVDVLSFFSWLHSVVRIDGYVSKASAQGGRSSTASVLAELLRGDCRDEKSRRAWEERRPTPRDAAKAEEAIAAANACTNNSDYWHNVRVILAGERIDVKRFGLMASVPTALGRMAERRAEQTATAAEAKHLAAKEGERVEVEATCRTVRHYVSDFGPKSAITLVCDDGAELVWLASGTPEVEQGRRYRGKVTVKSHGDYKGRLQTKIARASLVAVESAA